ncbi:MAG: short-chain dehydrogenase [Acidiphilium sp. 37-64-53]|uniref:SDR family NAD(P)-dependent oxidoreductase n=1 Tax=Acidiphilium TaxID=522 RepID=UPI000BC53D35|nr:MULTISPECIES: SDR family oxidoreductase [Acidiphilium]OYW04213.1 MAG: short-chain dehydrogenase [Acidiphilium sp. 37-64-53]OZB31144.1 MAG: short-chain dehydrogenase [Acidiphilium sp. 34-64-41]HQT83464.1 SDR family oxidoreductase [Acidiphilium rubrum]
MSDPIVILGATGGVGAALARTLAARGADLHLIGRDGAALAALATELGARHAMADVTDDAALTAAIAAAGPRIAGLAYCVGSIVMKPLKRATVADFADTYALNVIGAARAVAAAEVGLRATGGAVVLFSSVAARAGFPNHTVIGSAKAAVEGLAIALAAELAPVRVNCIAPSLSRTKMAAGLTGNEAMAKAIAAQHPIPRLGEAEDSAALAAFLLSADAGWITGQIIGVDGGRGILRTKP